MTLTPRTCATFCTFGLLAFVFTGCSAEAKKARTLAQADQHFTAGKYDEAEIEYKNLLQLDGLNAQAIGRLGQIYFEAGRVGLAYVYLKKGVELQPENLALRMKVATIYASVGQLDEAKTEALHILEKKPDDPEAPMLLSNAFNQKKDLEEIRQRLLQLPAQDGAPVLLALGTLEFRQRNLKEAEAIFRRAETKEPKSAAVHSALASILFAQDKRPEGEAEMLKAAELAPPRSPLRLQYVLYKLQGGDPVTARRLLEEMVQSTPDYLPALVTLAQLSLGEKKYDECEALLAKVSVRDATLTEALLVSSQLGLARGQNDKAVAEAEKALRLYPRNHQVLHQLGLAYLAGGQMEKAGSSFEQALSVNPARTDTALTLASLNLRKGDHPAAIIILKQIVQNQPDTTQAWALLAEAYRGQGSLADALGVYLEMDKRFPPSPQTPYLRGLVYIQQNRRAEARLEFAKALEIAPDFITAVAQLVTLDIADKQFATAEQRVQAIIDKDPKSGPAYLLLAGVHGAQKDNPKAEAALKKSIELQPDSPNAYYLLASLYFTQNEHKKALEDLKTLVARNPKDTQALLLMGTLNETIKDFPAAREAYEKLLAVNPRSAAALNNVAYIYSEQLNQLDKAADAAQKAREVAPQEPHIADTLGWILYKKGQYPRALSLLQESAGNLPTEPEILYHLGMIHYATGNEDAARTTLQRALAINDTFNGADAAKQSLAVLSNDGGASRAALEKAATDRPTDAMVLARLGAAYQQEGNTAKALTTYEAALKISPANTRASLGLIRLYMAQSDTAKALELARTARRLAPSDAEVAAVLGRLAYQTKDYSWALSLLQEASRRFSSDPEVLYDLANASYSMGRQADAEVAMRNALQANAQFANADKARRFLEFTALSSNPAQAVAAAARVEQALRTDPGDVPTLMAQATISEQKADLAGARQTYEKVLGVFPDFSPAMRRLAILYSVDPAGAPKALELGVKARETFPDDAELARAIGIAAYRQKDYSRSATWLRESSIKRADDATVHYYLGMARHQLKQTAPARESLQKALDLGLPNDLSTEARRVLTETP